MNTSERTQAMRQRRRAQGLCLTCSEPTATGSDCSECKNKKVAYMSALKHERRIHGLCIRCGKEPVPGTHKCLDCKTRDGLLVLKSQIKLRDEVFAAYGGYKCVECGVMDADVLTIDHINNNGSQHRKEIGLTRGGKLYSGGGDKMYRWLRARQFPSGYQVLCMNCNFKKMVQRMHEHSKYRVMTQSNHPEVN